VGRKLLVLEKPNHEIVQNVWKLIEEVEELGEMHAIEVGII
jgi:hypothetical protein